MIKKFLLNSNKADLADGSKIHQLPSLNQNFGLTSTQFDLLIEQVKNGNEDMFEKIFLSHFSDCRNYLINTYKADHEIAYDITMDTLLEFRKKILLNKITYGNLRYLFTKIASQLYIKYQNKESLLKNYITDEGEDTSKWHENIVELEKAWKLLEPAEKNLLEKHYYLDIPLNKIAEAENKSDVSIRKQKQRALDKLR